MRYSVLLAAIALAVVIVAGIATNFEASSAYGRVSIGVRDQPITSVSHLYLVISNIEFQGAGNSSTTYQTGQVNFDLFSLVNVTKMLGSVDIPSGNYTMIRFSIDSAIATILGQNVTLKVPSGEMIVPIHFEISSGKATTIILNITSDETSISTSLNLRPTVTAEIVG